MESPVRAPALAVLGGALLASATPALDFAAAPWLALSALYAALGPTVQRTPPLRAATAGALFGFVAHALALPSLPSVFARFGGLGAGAAWAVALGAWLLQGLPYAVACLVAAWYRGARWLAFPFALTAACAFTPQLFPFQPGALAVEVRWFAQIAELGGGAALTLCMALAVTSLVELARLGRVRLGLLTGFVVGAAFPAAYGAGRSLSPPEEHGELRLGVVQPNFAVTDMLTDPGRLAALTSLRALTADVEREGVAATLWGESAYPFTLSRTRREQPIDGRRIVGGAVRGPIVTGAITRDPGAPALREFNSAWLVGSDGALTGRVDKQQLVPFAEFVPTGPLLDLLGVRARGILTPGQGGVLPLARRRLGVLVCYEDLFGDLASARVREGADVLVNLTNDGWFAGGPEPALHERLARLRAIETRRDLVRVTTSGVSVHVAASGALRARLGPGMQGTFVARATAHRALTPYVVFGDWLPWLCVLGLVPLALLGPRVRAGRRARKPF